MSAPSTILVIDDSPIFREELRSALVTTGHDVVLASAGEEGLRLATTMRPTAILVGSVLPGIDGATVVRRLRLDATLRRTPCLLFAASEATTAEVRALDAGADGFVRKGEEMGVILGQVASLLATEARAAREIAECRADLTAELERVNKELEALSHSVSHDLRGPLRAVNGFASILLRKHAPSMSADAQELLQCVIQGGQRMDHLIDDLLRFVQLSRQPLNNRPVDVGELVREVLRELPSEDSRRAEVLVGQLPGATADRALLKQVFTNLLSNAFKFTRQRAQAAIEVGSRPEEGRTAYLRRDNGAGFAMQYAGKLFGVFQRMHKQEDFEGTGIGLSIAQRIVQRHGGRIWAEAVVNEGATFSFTLSP